MQIQHYMLHTCVQYVCKSNAYKNSFNIKLSNFVFCKPLKSFLTVTKNLVKQMMNKSARKLQELTGLNMYIESVC